jgi:hypothetical protein
VNVTSSIRRIVAHSRGVINLESCQLSFGLTQERDNQLFRAHLNTLDRQISAAARTNASI